MKLRVLISILFIIATTLSALHELKHLDGEHNSLTCKVCVANSHAISADVIDTFHEVTPCKFQEIILPALVCKFHEKDTSYQSRAPPLKS